MDSELKTLTSSELTKKIDEFRLNWIATFEEIKNEPIDPSAFEYMENALELSSKRINLEIMKHNLVHNKDIVPLDQKFQFSLIEISMYMVKAYALSTSKWREKHPGIFSSLILSLKGVRKINLINLEPPK